MKPLRYYGNKIVLSVKIQMKKIVWKIVTDYRWNKVRSENWPISSKMVTMIRTTVSFIGMVGFKFQWKWVQDRMGRETLDRMDKENSFQEFW